MPTRTARRFRAFTLIELLVVISILVLLLAILIPSLSRGRNAARRVTCISHMGGIGNGITGYSGDNLGILPFNNGDWADLIVKYFDGDAKPGDGSISVACQPYTGNYYENNDLNAGKPRGVVLSKRMNCPGQPMTCRSAAQGGYLGWGSSTGSRDNMYDTHYMLRLRNAPSRLTDFPANQYAAVTEPCGEVFDHNNRYYDGTLGYTTWVAAFVNIEWAPFLPHDLTNSPTTVTSAQISAVAGTHSGYNTPKRKDNPTTNATFLDGHVATWSYQQLVAWAAAYRSGSGGCYPPFFGDTSGG